MFSFALFITAIIHMFIVFESVLATNVIIDTKKGITLHHIGAYYEKFEESIFRIFIPFNDLCHTSPTLDVCDYVQSKGPNALEIGTMMPHSKPISSVCDKENVSFIIQEDIQRVFASQRIDKIIQNDEQIAELLPLADLTRDIKLDVTNIKESKQIFVNMILGQSVYAFRSCSIKNNDDNHNGPQCLVVSTICRKTPMDSSTTYQVYRLIPLPVLFNGNRYVYSNLPKVFGINTIEKKVILWDDDEISTNCILSTIIHCRELPMTVLLSSMPCLNELINTEFVVQDITCDVIESKDNRIGVINIINNIWYIYSPDELSDCNIQSLLSSSTDKQFTTYPLIVQLPCTRLAQYSSIRLPSMECTDVNAVLKLLRI